MFNIFKKKFERPDMTEFEFSRDAAHLSRYWTQLLFLYCNCQSGQQFNDKVKSFGEKLSPGFTSKTYTVWKRNEGSVHPFPIAIENEKKYDLGEMSNIGRPSRILGEVWLVRPQAIFELDKFFQNGIYFKRKRVKIHIPYRIKTRHTTTGLSAEVFNEYVDMWMYEGRSEFWDKVLDGDYSPVKMYSEKQNSLTSHYYFFNEKFK